MKIDTLQIYYDGFINQQSQGEFLRKMADYIEFAINDKDCSKIILDIPRVKQRFILENVDSEIVASKKVRLVKKDFQDIFKNEDKTEDLSFNGNSFEIKSQHTFEIEKKIKDGQGTTLWDAWEKMCLAYLIILKKDKVLTDPQQRDEYDMFIFESNPELVDEIKQLEAYSKNKINIGASLPEMLVKENYKPYAEKVHNYMLEKLNENVQVSNNTNTKTEIVDAPIEDGAVFTMTYDSKYRKIFINGHQVRKFDMDSENVRVFEDVYNNPNTTRELKSKRRAQDFVNAFGFRNRARDMFFPTSSGNKLFLNNPVSKNDLRELNLEHIRLEDLIQDIR